jgi:hypothetical protein
MLVVSGIVARVQRLRGEGGVSALALSSSVVGSARYR